LTFVGACLQAICAGDQAFVHAKIRRQASSYRGEDKPFVDGEDKLFVCRGEDKPFVCRGENKPFVCRGKNKPFVFVGACLQAIRAGDQAFVHAKIRR
jgi:hypothetical protein